MTCLLYTSRLAAGDPEGLLPQIEEICTSIEPDVRIVRKETRKTSVGHAVPRTKTYILENLGCAHCASNMEQKIAQLPGVGAVTLTYATKQLRITAPDPEEYLPQIQKICTSIEKGVKVVDRDTCLLYTSRCV